tara:strand:- start:906 stop:1619 length:714 start_codon:yes stop_codon:yes gene_type:complete
MATHYNFTGNIVTDGLVLNLDATKKQSYPGSGNAWYDLSGNGNHGVLSGASVQDAGTAAQGIAFDGSDDKVTIPADSTLRPTTALTMEAWVYLNSYAASWYTVMQAPQSNSAHSTPYFDWGLYIHSTGGLHARIDGESDNLSAGTTTKVQTATWTQVAITWTGGTNEYYIQGQPVQTKSITTTSITYDNNTDVLLGINAGNTEDLNGNLTAVRLYSKALTASEILQNYNALKGRYGL